MLITKHSSQLNLIKLKGMCVNYQAQFSTKFDNKIWYVYGTCLPDDSDTHLILSDLCARKETYRG